MGWVTGVGQVGRLFSGFHGNPGSASYWLWYPLPVRIV